MSPAVVFLPDTALLVPGAAGRADPAAALRDAALAALREAAADAAGPVLVVAPARRARTLTHPVATGFGAAGLAVDPGSAGLAPDLWSAGLAPDPGSGDLVADARSDGSVVDPGSGCVVADARSDGSVVDARSGCLVADARPDRSPADPRDVRPRADVPASVALALLRAAGVTAPVDVVEVPRGTGEVPVLPRGAGLLVAVGSPSARDGEDAPLAADPRAGEVDAALLAGLAGGPDALGAALAALGPQDAAGLAVSGWAPWSAAVSAVGDVPVRVAAHVPGVVAGAPHCVAAWLPAHPAHHAAHHPAHHPEETR